MNDKTETRQLQISAGTGPREVRVFVAHLGDVLEQLCAARGIEITARASVGDEHEPRSLALELGDTGDVRAALGHLLGTHELVMPRLARRRGRSRGGERKRWFAGVSLHALPRVPSGALDELDELMDPAQLEIRCDRAGGPGGQHVNTCASAVRIVHRPTGLGVRVAGERSQHQNRKLALERLAAMLHARAQVRASNARADKRRAHYEFERGKAVARWRICAREDRLVRADREE